MNLYINGTSIAAISNDEIKGDRAGLLVAGLGRFGFDNLTVYQVRR